MSPSLWADDTNHFDVLSCDIFDTAIERTLARPQDVWLAVGARLRLANLITCTPEAFAVFRGAAEAATRAQAEGCGHDEVRIAEIYDYLDATDIVSDPQEAARIEFATEIAICRPISAVQTALTARIAAGGRVVFASDSVLPGAWLTELLHACGFGEGCYVVSSADARKSKHTGRLFPELIVKLACASNKILHVGDNPVSDVIRPRAHGIAAHHIPRPRPQPHNESSGHYLVRLADSRRRATTAQPSPPVATGHMLAALATPLLLGFAQFIVAQARTRGIRRIYFLARDGYLPLVIIRQIITDDTEFDLVYLAVSRQSLSEDKASAKAYLHQADFIAPGPRLIVDLGWRGSLQTRLAEIAELPPQDVIGCYVGLWADALRPTLNPSNATGYLFTFGDNAARTRIIRESYLLLELIFSAPHGTVRGYQATTTDGVQPIYAPEDAPGGDARRAAFADLQNQCLQTIAALQSMAGDIAAQAIDAQSALSPLVALLTTPTRQQVNQINRTPFIHDDTTGALLPAVNPLPLHEAALSPRRALARLARAPWRAGAVRAALPWPIPFMDYATLADRVARVLRW